MSAASSPVYRYGAMVTCQETRPHHPPSRLPHLCSARTYNAQQAHGAAVHAAERARRQSHQVEKGITARAGTRKRQQEECVCSRSQAPAAVNEAPAAMAPARGAAQRRSRRSRTPRQTFGEQCRYACIAR